MTDQKERLKKLYALAMRGVGGEKETAAAILAKLTKKYKEFVENSIRRGNRSLCEYYPVKEL